MTKRVPHDWKELYTIGAPWIGDTLADARQRGLKHYKNVCSKHGGVVFLAVDNSCPYCCKEAKQNRHARDSRFNKIRETLGTIRRRAMERGIECTITLEYLRSVMVTTTCPALGIPMMFGQNLDNSPSVDRLDSSKGYTPDNIRIISTRANRIKSDGNIEEHLKIAAWMAKEQSI